MVTPRNTVQITKFGRKKVRQGWDAAGNGVFYSNSFVAVDFEEEWVGPYTLYPNGPETKKYLSSRGITGESTIWMFMPDDCGCIVGEKFDGNNGEYELIETNKMCEEHSALAAMHILRK